MSQVVTTPRSPDLQRLRTDPIPTTVRPAAFRAAFRQAPAGLAILTTSYQGAPAGLTVTSLRSLSAEPALVTFSITRAASTWTAFSHAGRVLVHLLDQGQRDLAERFATSDIDRFAAPVSHRPDPHGLPWLRGPAATLQCEIVDQVTYGDADLFVAAVSTVHHDGEHREPTPGLVYHDGGFHRLGVEP